MGNRLCGTNQPTNKKNRSKVHHHHDKIPNKMGRSSTSEGLQQKTITHFLFEQVITRFGCPRVLMSDQGTHFINNNINAMNEEFEVHHQKRTPYHP
jgi:hypothetical protein